MSRRAITRDDAVESIEAIRSVLDRTTRYTHISWAAIVMAGAAALLAAGAGWAVDISPSTKPAAFLLLWSGTLVTAGAFGCATTARNARRAREPFWSRKLQVVTLGFLPAAILGSVITVLLAETGRLDLAPGFWMGLYGVGILAVGHVLDWEFQVTAWAFLVSASVALFPLRDQPHLAMLLAFGGIHLGLGAFRHFKERR
jgi:hypothetical protein